MPKLSRIEMERLQEALQIHVCNLNNARVKHVVFGRDAALLRSLLERKTKFAGCQNSSIEAVGLATPSSTHFLRTSPYSGAPVTPTTT